MPKFGQFRFGEAKFGTSTPAAGTVNRTYASMTAGLIVRRHIGKKVIYRYCNGRQYKYDYFIPANPQTVAQQDWRTTFKSAVFQATSLSTDDREVWKEIAKYHPGWTWWSAFMADYLWQQSH